MERHSAILENTILTQLDKIFQNQSEAYPVSSEANDRRGSRVPPSEKVPVMSLVWEPSEKPTWQNVLPMKVSVHSEYFAAVPSKNLAGVINVVVAVPAEEVDHPERTGVKSGGVRTVLNKVGRSAGLTPVGDGERFKWEMEEGSPAVKQGEVYIIRTLLGKQDHDHYYERHTLFFNNADTQKVADGIARMAREIGKGGMQV